MNPIQAAPLPKAWHVSGAPAPGWRVTYPIALGLVVGTSTAPVPLSWLNEPGPNGFNKFAFSVLGRIAEQGLWGQPVPCQLVAENQVNHSYVARSNVQMLDAPTVPTVALKGRDLLTGTPVDPQPLVGLSAPTGRMLYFSREPNSPSWGGIPRVWFVRPDMTLETGLAQRGFDPFTFWLSAYSVMLKNAQNVSTGELLAQRLNAYRSSFLPASGPMSALAAAIGPNLATELPLMWTATRVVSVVHMSTAPFNLAVECNASGVHRQDIWTWLASENPATVWQCRVISFASIQTPVYGITGLPGYVPPPPVGALAGQAVVPKVGGG